MTDNQEKPVLLSNNNCSGAIPIRLEEGSATVSGTSVGALAEDSSVVPSYCETVTQRGVWYQLTIRGRKEITFSTCNQASFDTQIHIFEDPHGSCEGRGNGRLECIAGQDDNSAAGCLGYTTELGADTLGATKYYILVHGYNDATGTFDLSVNIGKSTGAAQRSEIKGDCQSFAGRYCKDVLKNVSNPKANLGDCREFLCKEQATGRPGSCDNHCGKHGGVYGYDIFDCWCDDSCTTYGDCCSDFHDYCPSD